MSVTELLDSAKELEAKNFETLYRKLVALRVERKGVSLLDETESTLLTTINTEFDPKKWERLTHLDWKMEFGALSKKEEAESLKLAEAYENYSVERLKNLSQLALRRQISIDKLMEQLGISS